MKAEKHEKGPFQFVIRDIPGDMGELTKLDLIIQEDGDAILTLRDTSTGQSLSIEFCTFQGGTHTPGLALRLKDLSEYLYKLTSDPDSAQRMLQERLIDKLLSGE